MLMSKVRIEFTEEKSPGKFNVFANESGTVGENNLGQDLAYSLNETPRALLVLATAIVETFERGSVENHLLLNAAKSYIARWVNYDACLAQGQKPSDLLWPDADESLTRKAVR